MRSAPLASSVATVVLPDLGRPTSKIIVATHAILAHKEIELKSKLDLTYEDLAVFAPCQRHPGGHGARTGRNPRRRPFYRSELQGHDIIVYLAPPENPDRVDDCDEKSQIQALNRDSEDLADAARFCRTAHLPLRPARTTTLFAALDIAPEGHRFAQEPAPASSCPLSRHLARAYPDPELHFQ